MGRFFGFLTERPRLSVGLALLLSAAGVAAWFQMPREEDPSLRPRFGLILAPFPGADVEKVERLVVQPLEDELAEVADVGEVRVTIRSGIAILNVELRQAVNDTQPVWDDVQDAIDDAYAEMPEAAIKPDLDYELNNTESVVVALTGPSDVLYLADRAEELRRSLLAVPEVFQVDVTGDPDEQITIAMDEATADRIRLSPEQLASILEARNVSVPGGSIRVGSRQVELRPASEMRSVEELRNTPVVLPSGAAVPLSTIADIRRAPAEPMAQRARIDGKAAVFVGAVPRKSIDAVRFGDDVSAILDRYAAAHPELTLERVAYQPDKVDARLSELGTSLLVGIGIVALVLLFTMGFRIGIVVASVVPLVTFAALAIYAFGGGVFHQMAAAALVLALGLLVDNAIVMTELIQSRLEEGLDRRAAVLSAIRELAVPLFSATATTLAAFVPMLLAPGTTGEFTRAIPVVTMITLCVSYVFAMAVTPVMAGFFLKGRRQTTPSRLERFASRIGAFAGRRPVIALLATMAMVFASGAFVVGVQQNFFPSSDRDQMVISLQLPEGSHLDYTDDSARQLESALQSHPRVQSVSAFVGRSTPKFYYNLPLEPNAPNLAQFIVTTDGADAVNEVIGFVRGFAKTELSDAVVVPRRLEQGPPIPAPVEVRLFGDDLQDLFLASEIIRGELRDIDGTIDIRANHGPGTPLLSYTVDEAEAGRRGIQRGAVALAMFGRTRGLPAGTYRGGDDPTPIRLRASSGENHSPAHIDAIGVTSPGGRSSPLGHLTTSELRFGPAVIHHFNGRRTVSVFSEVERGATYAAIVKELTPRLEAQEFPPGVTFGYGGAIESSGDANKGLGQNAPLAALLLIAILIAQFNSIRRMAIVLFTAPLAMLGIWPGLFIGNLPFGFVALLGAIALIGIVVNGAIVLIDVIDSQRKKGASIPAALEYAVGKRTRPIVLTALTTVAGLTPLLFSKSTLWPPMAAAMISGLTVATLLTLIAVPALYRLLFREAKPKEATS
ncbi:MAG: efflux RND transporter permease subunit [Myxococcota bacterium]